MWLTTLYRRVVSRISSSRFFTGLTPSMERIATALEDRNALLQQQLQAQGIRPSPATRLPSSYRLRRRTEADITIVDRETLLNEQIKREQQALHPDETKYGSSNGTANNFSAKPDASVSGSMPTTPRRP